MKKEEKTHKEEASTSRIPLGTIVAYALKRADLPKGWLLCDGSKIPAQYEKLIEAMGPVTPNLKGRTVIGVGNLDGLNYELKQTGGQAYVTLNIDEIPPHTHGYQMGTIGSIGLGDKGNVEVMLPYDGGQTTSAGGGRFHNNLQPYYALNYIIYAGGE